MHYTSGTTGRPKGVTTGSVGRGDGRARLRGRGGGLALRPVRPAHGLFADVPHGVRALLDRHAAGRRLPGHPAPLRRRRRHSTPCGASARRRRSSCRRICSGSCSTRTSMTTRPSTRCACSPTRARPAPSRSSGRPWPEPVPASSGSSTARRRPSTPCARPTTGSTIPARSDGPVPDAGSPSHPSTSTTTRPDLVDEVGVGAIWCDQPVLRSIRYWRNPEATAARLARVAPAPSATSAGSIRTASST